MASLAQQLLEAQPVSLLVEQQSPPQPVSQQVASGQQAESHWPSAQAPGLHEQSVQQEEDESAGVVEEDRLYAAPAIKPTSNNKPPILLVNITKSPEIKVQKNLHVLNFGEIIFASRKELRVSGSFQPAIAVWRYDG